LKELSVAQAYLSGSLRGQAGTDGLRTVGYWEQGSKGRERREGEHRQSETTITVAHTRLHLPPAARPHLISPNSFSAQ